MFASLQKNVAVAFTVALFFILTLGGLQYRNTLRLNSDNQWVSHTQLVLRVIGAVRTRLERADAAAQSFVITGDTAYLAAYNQATKEMAEQLQSLRQETSDNPEQQQRIDRLEPLIANTFAGIQKEIDARNAATFRADALLPLETDIRQGSDAANAVIAELANAEVDLFNQRSAMAQQSNHRANLLILFSTLTALMLVITGGVALYLDISERARAERRRAEALEAQQIANQELEKEVLERTAAQAKLRDSEASLRELSLHLLRTQDEERRRFGRELHDSVGQHLAALKLELGALLLRGRDNMAQNLTDCMSLADESIREVRTISYLLHPPLLEEMGLREVIPWYVEGFSKRSGIHTTLEMDRDLPRLPAEVELVVVRVLQESLTNVHRHSGHDVAHVRLRAKDDSITLEVQDEGKGLPFAVPAGSFSDQPGPWGVGLQGMSERVKDQGGKLEIVSRQRGTLVRITLPHVPVPTPQP